MYHGGREKPYREKIVFGFFAGLILFDYQQYNASFRAGIPTILFSLLPACEKAHEPNFKNEWLNRTENSCSVVYL